MALPRATGLEGLTRMARTIDKLDGAAKKGAKAGVNAGLTVLARQIRKEIDGTSASPELKRAAKKTVGKRLSRKPKAKFGKAGFGVGKPSKKKREQSSARASSSTPGVGISASSVHWFVLGTDQRKTASGANRGKVQDVLKGVVKTAVGNATRPMMAAAQAKVKQVLAREAAKAKPKGS